MTTYATTPIVYVSTPTVLQVSAPVLGLYGPSGTDTSQSVISPLAQTIRWNYDATATKEAPVDIIDVAYTFELLSALLDTAPTQASSGTTLFTVTIILPGTFDYSKQFYYIDATIQTKGNSALSPTYRTIPFKTSTSPTQWGVNFPVTNFFNVSAPGAPYTLFLYVQRARADLPPSSS